MLTKLLKGKVNFEENKLQSLFVNKIIEQVQSVLFPKKVAVVGGGIFGCTIIYQKKA